MQININCKSNDHGVWCKDKRIKRSIFGIGARMCQVAEENKPCPFQEKYEKPPYIQRKG